MNSLKPPRAPNKTKNWCFNSNLILLSDPTMHSLIVTASKSNSKYVWLNHHFHFSSHGYMHFNDFAFKLGFLPPS